MDFSDINPTLVAAIVYRPENDVDTLLADFAFEALNRGERIGGVVQRNLKDDCGRKIGMNVIDLESGRAIPMCQNLGPGAMACKLDAASLAEASLAILRAVARKVDLLIVNKFSKQEAAGRGLRQEIAAAIAAGVPVLTATPVTYLDAWTDFTGDIGTTLLHDAKVGRNWWRDARPRPRPQAFAAATFQSSHPTT